MVINKYDNNEMSAMLQQAKGRAGRGNLSDMVHSGDMDHVCLSVSVKDRKLKTVLFGGGIKV